MNGMATKPVRNVRALILDAVDSQDYRPADLLSALMLQSSGLSEGELKDELAALLSEGVLELSSTRYLTMRRQMAAS